MYRLTDLLAAIGKTARGYVTAVICRLETMRNGGRRRRMRVVESLALGGRRQLLLVICDEQEYLVGTGAESVETIVPRQPPQLGTEHETTAAAQPTRGRQQAGATNAAAARHAFGQIPGNASGTAYGHGAALLRERTTRGPWLMTPKGHGVFGNRITEEQMQETKQSGGRHLWQ